MNGKTARMIRKEFNSVRRSERVISENLVRELLNAPFKIRFMFAMRILFPKTKGM